MPSPTCLPWFLYGVYKLSPKNVLQNGHEEKCSLSSCKIKEEGCFVYRFEVRLVFKRAAIYDLLYFQDIRVLSKNLSFLAMFQKQEFSTLKEKS